MYIYISISSNCIIVSFSENSFQHFGRVSCVIMAARVSTPLWPLLALAAIVVLESTMVVVTATMNCNRQPYNTQTEKEPGDNGYKIKISGNPEKYVPGEVYTGN